MTSPTMTNQDAPIELFQPTAALGVPNLSPFCVKLETWLRMHDLPFRVRSANDPRKAPKGKVPYVRFRGRMIGDSELIIAVLRRELAIADGLPDGPAAAARATAITRLLEDHLYFAMLFSRWMEPDVFAIIRPIFFGGFPFGARQLLPMVALRMVRRQLYEQGTGRHSREDIYAMGIADIDAMATLLGDGPFALGETPSDLDATVYGFLANLVDIELDTPLNTATRRHSNLVEYTARMGEQYYGAG